MIHCYIDESGNTGGNLFDPDQPYFYSGALIAPYDFDRKYPDLMRAVAKANGEAEFHANVLGMGRIKSHLASLQTLIKRDNLRFYIGRVEKRHLALLKFFDVYFDSTENRAVPWHVYNSLEMRFCFISNLEHFVNDEARRELWAALMDGNEASATKKFLRTIELVESELPRLPEPRTREITQAVLKWARENGEAFGYFAKKKRNRIPHLPNLAAFPDMLEAFDRQADYQGTGVAEIKHDRQCQVQDVLREWHHLFTNASDEEIEIFGQSQKFRSVPDSKFLISSSKESTGIQLIDLVLWLCRQKYENGPLPPEATAFLGRVERHAEFFDMSKAQTIKRSLEINEAVFSRPFGPAEEAKGRQFLREIEARRTDAMAGYSAAKEVAAKEFEKEA